MIELQLEIMKFRIKLWLQENRWIWSVWEKIPYSSAVFSYVLDLQGDIECCLGQ
jgi:hypothetical protein